MIQKLEDWVKEISKSKDFKEIYYSKFLSKKPDNIIFDENIMLTPAEGTIIYSEVVSRNKFDFKIIEIKGKNYSLYNLLNTKKLKHDNYIIIGIFMTTRDNHFQIMPTTGYIQSTYLRPIKSFNLPMDKMQTNILKHFTINYDDASYLYINERVVNEVYDLSHRFKYYIVQIADLAVNSILNKYDREVLFQGCMFGHIDFGSQVDLVVPVLPEYKYKLFATKGYHIDLYDPLLKIIRKK